MNSNNKSHPKAAFALFLNQAEHNVEIAAKIILNIKPSAKGDIFKNIIKKIDNELKDKSQLADLKQKYFRFLQQININDFENSKQLFLELLKTLNNIRNYYSHFYYIPEIKKEFEINSSVQHFLEDTFDQSYYLTSVIYGEKNTKDIKKYRYKLFETKDNETVIKKIGIVFLTNLFLNKRQSNLLVSSVNDLKGNDRDCFKATREYFINFCIKNPKSEFNTDNSNAQFFFNAIAHLSKIPKIVEDNLTAEYKESIKDEENNTRTSRDKFTYFALRYIDDFALLPDVKFKVYIRTYDSENNEIREGQYLSLEERKKYFKYFEEKRKKIAVDKNKEYNKQNYNLYDYVIKNKNVLFEIDNSDFTSWILTVSDFKKLRAELKAKFIEKEKSKNAANFDFVKATKNANKKADDLILQLNPNPKKKNYNSTLPKQIKNHFFKNKFDLEEVLNSKINKDFSKEDAEILTNQAEKKLKGTISIHELRNFVFGLIFSEKYVKLIFENYLKTYRDVYKTIIEGNKINYVEIKEKFKNNVKNYLFFEKELPKSIRKWIEQNEEFNEDYWKKYIDSLVQFNNNPNNNVKKDIPRETTWNIINNKNLYSNIVKGKTENLEKIEAILKNKINIEDSNIKEKIQKWVCRKFTNKDDETEIDNVSYYSAIQKKEVLVRLYNLKETINKFEQKNKFQIINSIIKIITDFKLKPNKGLSQEKSKEIYDKEWYEKIQIALGNKNFREKNILEQIDQYSTDVLNFKETLKNSNNLENFYQALQSSYIAWCKNKINSIEDNCNPDIWKETAKFLGIHIKQQNNERIADIAAEYFNVISIPRGFITHTQKFHTSKKEHNKRKAENKLRSKISEDIDKQSNNIDISEFYNKTKESKNDKNLYQKINEEKQKDKVLLLIANEYLKNRIADTGVLKKKPKIENILTEGNITLNIENKKIEFKINDYHKINPVINDKRRDKIFKNYVKENSIKYKDLHEILTKIETQQKDIVDDVLKFEKKIILNYLIQNTYNSEKYPKLAEFHIDTENRENIELSSEELKKYNEKYQRKFNKTLNELHASDKNRIETITILKKFEIEDNNIDLSKIPQDVFNSDTYKQIAKKYFSNEQPISKTEKLIVLILYYRNKAFHNSIPDTGTFEEGISLLNNLLEKETESN